MSRIGSVDVFRLIAVIAVITMHMLSFRADISIENEEYCRYFYVIINQFLRFAVPFFFVISGYFWGAKIRNSGCLLEYSLNMAKRISYIFVAWCIIYLLPFNLGALYSLGMLGPIKKSYWRFCDLIQQPVALLLLQGTEYHLWFLPAILFALSISVVFVYKKQIKSLVLFSMILYVFGVLAKSYANTPIGIHMEFNTRNGPFFSTFLFVTGYLMSGINANTRWLVYGFIIFCAGTCLHFLEIYMLWTVFGISPIQDFVIGTYFMGVGVAMVALSDHSVLKSHLFSKVGRLTLGIYAVHAIFVSWLRPIYKITDSVLWEIGSVAVVFVLSVISSILLSKSKITRKLVI